MNTRQYLPITDRLPEGIIAFRSDGAVRVDHFFAAAEALSHQLPGHQYVFNLFIDRYQYLLGFCACVMAGQCTLLPPNRLEKTLGQLASEYPDSYVLGDTESSHHAVFATGGPGKLADVTHSYLHKVAEDQLCAIAVTSGSTGNPTTHLKYWKTLRTGGLNNAGLLLKDIAGQMSLLATVPPQHMWGFETSILMPLFANAAVSQLAPFYPQDIVNALESLPQPRGLISSPAHLRVLLKSGVRAPGLDRIYSATAPLDRKLAQELERCFKTEVVEIFGSSETGVLASRHSATESAWQVSELFELDVQKDGVLVRGQHLPEPVFLQDVIEKTGEHQFRLLGRHVDMINIAGKRGSLTDLNRRLLAIPGVVDGVVFLPESNTERLAALVVAPSLLPADILAKLKLEIDPLFLPRPVFLVSGLPRQETGKLAHKDLMNLFRDMRQREKQASRVPTRCDH